MNDDLDARIAFYTRRHEVEDLYSCVKKSRCKLWFRDYFVVLFYIIPIQLFGLLVWALLR